MKSFTPIALSALLVVAAAVPLEKRDYTTTIIEDVTETVDVYTTVLVQPGDPRLLQNHQALAQTSPSFVSAVSTSAQTSSTPVYIPQQNKEAAYVAPAPSSTPVPTSTSTPVPSITPSSTPAVVAQPELLAAAPVQSPPAPPSSPSPSSNSGPSGGACGTINGKCTAGDMTTFDGSTAPGSCGWIDGDKSPNYVALAHEMMGTQSNGGGSVNPYCGRTLKISANGQEYDAVLTDKCMGCDGQSLDLSLTLFNQIFPTAGGTGRFHNIDWWFTS